MPPLADPSPAWPPDPWAPFSHAGTRGVGILVSHGFTAGPASVRPLAQGLAAAGYDVEVPLLPGHGTTWEDLAETPATAWSECLARSLQTLQGRCDQVFVMGLSMGGTLALQIALAHPEVRGVVVINHALWFGNPLVPFARLLKGLLPSTPAIASDIRKAGVVEPAYDRTPSAGVARLYALARAVRADLPSLATPLLVFKSRRDHVLPRRNGPRTLLSAGSRDKALVWLEHSYHVATLDDDADLILDHCLAFVRRLSERP